MTINCVSFFVSGKKNRVHLSFYVSFPPIVPCLLSSCLSHSNFAHPTESSHRV